MKSVNSWLYTGKSCDIEENMPFRKFLNGPYIHHIWAYQTAPISSEQCFWQIKIYSTKKLRKSQKTIEQTNTKANNYSVFIPRHTLVARYYVIPISVCPSVRPSIRPCSPFPIDNLSIYSRNFFKFCIHIVIGDEWYGIVNGQNPSIFNGVTALFRIGKMVSGLLFLYCSWYPNETSQICCTSKVTYCD